jgi:hypothetical protein
MGTLPTFGQVGSPSRFPPLKNAVACWAHASDPAGEGEGFAERRRSAFS